MWIREAELPTAGPHSNPSLVHCSRCVALPLLLLHTASTFHSSHDSPYLELYFPLIFALLPILYLFPGTTASLVYPVAEVPSSTGSYVAMCGLVSWVLVIAW